MSPQQSNSNTWLYPGPVTDLIARQARLRPDATAIESRDGILSYSELWGRSGALALQLEEMGHCRQRAIGVYMQRSPGYVVAAVAILRAGGVFVPLDINHPAERLRFILDEVDPSFVFVRSNSAAGADIADERRVSIDALGRVAGHEGREYREVPIDARDNAYVIFTSGSTGRPKGVLCHHGGLRNLVDQQCRHFGFDQSCRTLQASSPSFDAFIWEVFGTLGGGGTLCLLTGAALPSPEVLEKEIRHFNANHLTLVPSLLDLLNAHQFPSLRVVISAGEPCTTELARRWAKGRRFINAYGPSECSVCATFADLSSGSGEVSIGKPIPNVRVHILDDQGVEVGPDVRGEIFIGGVGVGTGYLNSPDLSAERFIPDPSSRDPQARLFRTGDYGKLNANGDIVFLGRADAQVKVRGQRVELEEIEACVREKIGVAQVAVLLEKGDESGGQIALYMGLGAKSPIPTDQLRERLAELLPYAMIPHKIVQTASLPLSPSGKVDRQQLRALDRPAPKRATVEARTPQEGELLSVWKQVLHNDSIGVTDNFFDLGGDSLDAATMLARLEKSAGREIPISVLISAPTVEKLAASLSASCQTPEGASLIPVQTGGDSPPLFFVALWGDHVLRFSALAKCLEPHQVILGLMPSAANGNPKGHVTVEEIAAELVQEMRKTAPSGPYRLAGSSFSGCIAFEMAQQLRACGERVSHLVIFDTHLPVNPRSFRRLVRVEFRVRATVHSVRHYIRAFRRIAPAERLAVLRSKLAERLKRPVIHYRNVILRNWSKGTHSLDVADTSQWSVYRRAAGRYVARSYWGTVDYICPRPLEYSSFVSPIRIWSELVGDRLKVHEVAGDHRSLLKEPYVAAVAKKVSAILREDRHLGIHLGTTYSESGSLVDGCTCESGTGRQGIESRNRKHPRPFTAQSARDSGGSACKRRPGMWG